MKARSFIIFTWELFRPVFWKGTAAILLGCLTILSSVGLIGTSTYLLSYAALQPSISALQVAIIGVRFFGISRSALRYVERLASHTVNLHMVGRLRAWFYQQVINGYPRVLSQHQTGDLLDRALADITVLEQVFVRVMAPPAIAILVTAFTALFLSSLHPVLARVYLLAAGGSGLIVLGLSVIIHAWRLDRYADARSLLHAWLTSLVSGNADIRINGQPAVFRERLRLVQAAYSRMQRQAFRTSAALNAMLTVFSGLGMLTILIIAINIHANQQLDGRLIATAALLVFTSFEAYLPFPLLGQHLAQAMQSVKRLLEMKVTVRTNHRYEGKALKGSFEQLEFRQVTFHYPDVGEPVLQGLNLQVNRGERVAIVGPSGIGKTTLIHLLLGFWQPVSGEVLINGLNISRYDPVDLRTLVRATSQDPYFFPGSIRQNLLLAKRTATEEELIAGLRSAGCLDWVTRLPSGLDEEVGERGSILSQGQRKRLDIARAFISDAPLLILDEPFAGLDLAAASALHRSLLSNSRERTIVIITHILDYLDEMDSIHVMKDGVIAENGTHQALLCAGGIYARMVALSRGRLDVPAGSTPLH